METYAELVFDKLTGCVKELLQEGLHAIEREVGQASLNNTTSIYMLGEMHCAPFEC